MNINVMSTHFMHFFDKTLKADSLLFKHILIVSFEIYCSGV